MAVQPTPAALTHVWLEAPLFPATLAMLPASVTVVDAAPAAVDPFSGAGPAQVIIASSRLRYDGAAMDALPNLRMIARTGIGVDNIDLAAATAHGIVVTNTPDGPTESTAEHTVAMLLALAKRLKQGNANLAEGNWGPRTGVLVGTEVQGKTLGLVGLGRIGRRVAQICRLAFDMNVLGYDPFVTAEQAASFDVTLTDLDDVIARADFLSLHVPATPETTGMINAARIAQMKDGAYLLNMARGPLIEPAALLDALDRGKLAGAGLDVFVSEPPARDDRLRDHPSVIATPHTASLTLDGRLRMERMAVERVLAFFSGATTPDVVNPDVLT
ncbi:MAG: hydroxyacid dehydrogenase [Caldilineaceae bacterium]|nr:hydroxyacid dehydrogenase [Caldilineaceae bacterium]